MATTPVRVALRVRPLSTKEQSDNCAECITFTQDEPQIFLGTDRAFTFDSVFQPSSTQEQIYSACIAPLVHRYLEGNNVTILAYGQTGSGKTYSMGTGPGTALESQDGIVQRFAHELFNTLEQQQQQQGNDFQVYASFLELYNEDIHDLLDFNGNHETTGSSETHPSIREDVDGNVYLTGVREFQVGNADELLSLLSKGIQFRATGSTDANTLSSRSHAIFSVLLKQQIHTSEMPMTLAQQNQEQRQQQRQQTPLKRLASKFHFVDLAGSERLKQTVGDRKKEGISINTGLLALGNVISALGDESRKGAHVPYRDSKLTRLLQNSLGGSSQTLMLACVSPADLDAMKTLNTLKYASRARNIQNRVEINHDYEGSPEELDFLRAKVKQLKMQVSALQKITGDDTHANGIINNNNSGSNGSSSYYYEFDRTRRSNQDMVSERARAQTEKDILRTYQRETISESHPMIREYAETVQDLRLQLAEAHKRLSAAINEMSSTSTPSPLHTSTSSSAISDITITKAAANRTAYASQSTSAVNNHHHRPMITFSARRRGKYVPVAARIIRQRRLQIKPSPSNSIFYTEEDSIQAPNISDDANNPMFVWSQSRVETVIPSMDLKAKEVLDNHGDGCPDLEKNDTLCAPGLPQPPSESTSYCGPTMSDMDDDDDMFDLENELETLQVPTWTDTPVAQSTNGSTSKRESCSWTDSLLDDSDNSVATSRLSSSWTTTVGTVTTTMGGGGGGGSSGGSGSSNNGNGRSTPSDTRPRSRAGSSASEAAGRRRSRDLLKMLHQVQADLLVKQELVGQLEKSEDEFAQIQSSYMDKLVELQTHLQETEKERDDALERNVTPPPPPVMSAGTSVRRRRPPAPPSSATGRTPASPLQTSRPNVLGLREARQADEVRRAYEAKVKKLTTENTELKRKYTQTNHTLLTAKTKAEQYIQKLRSEAESLKTEKKAMAKAHKAELDKVREVVKDHEHTVQVLKRKETALLDAKKKLEDQHEQQVQLARKRTDETAALAAQMRQMTFALRRAANEGLVLNEVLLDKILTQSQQQQQRVTKSPTAMRRISSEQQ